MNLADVPDLAWALAIIVAAPLTIVVLVAILRGYNVKVWRENHKHTTGNEDTDD